jgi:SH3 domain protein
MAGALLVVLTGETASAEEAWVGGEVRLNLRSGPSMGHRIRGVIVTGDRVTVLERSEEWTQVRSGDGEEGWIPAGYLAAQAPPTVRLSQLESEVETLRSSLEETSARAETLAAENTTLSGRDQEQQDQVVSLTRENLDLKAGARWPYLITGASILAAGMLLGLLLSRASGRRKARIKL